MTRILAIDAGTEVGGVALAGSDGLALERLLDAPDGYAHRLIAEIDVLLAEAGIGLHQVDAFAACAGPGSFTGVRVALAAAKGFGEALAKPVFAISNLAALASFGTAAVRAPVMDARRSEVFGAVYGPDGEVLAAETVGPFEAWRASVPAGAQLVTPDAGLLEAGAVSAPRNLALAAARIALARFEAGERPQPAASDANYVRRSDAELNWRDR